MWRCNSTDLVVPGPVQSGLYRQVAPMWRCNSTDLVVPGPVQSGLYRQVVLLYRWYLRQGLRCMIYNFLQYPTFSKLIKCNKMKDCVWLHETIMYVCTYVHGPCMVIWIYMRTSLLLAPCRSQGFPIHSSRDSRKTFQTSVCNQQ